MSERVAARRVFKTGTHGKTFRLHWRKPGHLIGRGSKFKACRWMGRCRTIGRALSSPVLS